MQVEKLINDLQDSLIQDKSDELPSYIKCLSMKQRYDLFYLLNFIRDKLNGNNV